MKQHGLSKSRITSFEQCPKKLWLSVHRRDLAEYDAGAEARFASGNAVGDIACAIHPSGVMVEAEPDLGAAVAGTEPSEWAESQTYDTLAYDSDDKIPF